MAPPLPPRELVYLGLDEVDSDETFRLREVGDVSSLAQSIAQLGQLFPVEVRLREGRYQLVTGFRRLAALRMLMRKRILVRVHGELSETDAALLAAADAIDNRSLELEELRAMAELYRRREWTTPALEEMIGRAIEKAEERIEDIEAALRGEPPPDRSIEDEDARPLPEEAPAPQPAPFGEGPRSVAAPPTPPPLGGAGMDASTAATSLLIHLGALHEEISRLVEGGAPLSPELLGRLARQAAAGRALGESLGRMCKRYEERIWDRGRTP